MDRFRHRLRAVPMLFVLVPFIAGIVVAQSYVMPLWCAIVGSVVALCCAVVALPRSVSYGFVGLALMLMGYLAVEVGARSSAIPYDDLVEMRVSVVSPIAEREGYSVAEGRVEAWMDDCWHDAKERVQLWIRTDTLSYGDRVHLIGRLRERISKYESYNALMHRRGYVGGVALSNANILGIEHNMTGGIRRYAIEKLDKYASDSASHSVVEAMVAGSRHAMTAELREAYSTTGLAHLMAVSGLHLGIVLLVVNALLRPLCFIHRGHILCNILTIIAVWLFALLSGASPSVVRAALMLSVLLLSNILSPKYDSMNALAFTVFVMLMCRADYLYDISFQLSVLAVVGIVAWGLPIIRCIKLKSAVVKSLITTVIIGVVATLWTLPIVSHTFGNIPIVGVVATPVVLLFAYVVVAAGIFVLILPHPLSAPFGYVAEWAAALQNSVVERFSVLPFASVEYTITTTTLTTYYVVFIAITALVWSINRKKELTLSYDIE